MKIWHKNSLILFLFLSSNIALSQNTLYIRDDSGKPKEENIKKKNESLLFEETFITNNNSDFDFEKTKHYTGSEVSRIAFAYHMSDKSLNAYDMIAMKKIDDYAKHWWGAGFRQLKSAFQGVSQNHEVSSTAPNTAESSSTMQRPNGSTQSLTTMMLGYGHRFRFVFAPLFEKYNWFETVQVYLTYNTLNDHYTGKSYKGPGLTMEYDVHKRAGTSMFYGGKFTYNMAQVTRSAIGLESRADRTLSIGFATLALHFGFYY